MVVMGNPPYAGESINKGDWIMSLMDDYKKEPGGKQKLQERNSKWINNDYVKFMRFGQHFIEKNGEGVLAFINPHSFLDNPTFRGMRWNLLKTYDAIYTIDLHGNIREKETAPDGSIDENVFDIEEGVSINILVKNGSRIQKAGDLGQIYHYDLYGKRGDKYQFLEDTAFKDVPYQEVPNVAPMYFMVPKDFSLQEDYDKGFSIYNLFSLSNVGIVTSRDALVIDDSKASLQKRIQDFFDLEEPEVKSKLGVRENKRWKISAVKNSATLDFSHIKKISYRPFDVRNIYFDSEFIERSRLEVMKHLIDGNNLGLVYKLGHPEELSSPVQVSKNIIEFRSWSRPGVQGGDYISPLYLYPDNDDQRIPNLVSAEIKAFEKSLKLPFKAENSEKSFIPSCLLAEYKSTDTTPAEFTPIDILDYIYAVLHSPAYREKYKEFLKIDYPKVPYPTPERFWQLVELGDQIRQLHLMESPLLDTPITQYPIAGDNVVTRRFTKTSPGYEATSDSLGRVWINNTQYFDNVPLLAWEFYIGGYQPAQKWLKDRVGRELSFDDILHYQRIIVVLTETDRLMKKVDELEVV